MSGQARISGYDAYTPSKVITVARSYVEGLERVRERYDRVQADHMRLNHEAINLAAQVLVLRKALRHSLPHLPERFQVVADEILDNADSVLEELYRCPCGHSSLEHDEDGCTYLHCRHVCA